MKRFLSLLLTVAMLATMFATMVLPAAAEGVAFKASFDTSYFTNGNSAVIVVAETADATYYVEGWSNVAFAPTSEANTFEVVQGPINQDLDVPENGFVLVVYTYAASNELDLIGKLSVGDTITLTGVDFENKTVAADATIECNFNRINNNVAYGKSYATSELYRMGGADVNWGYDPTKNPTYPDENGTSLTDGRIPVARSYGDAAWVGLHDGIENAATAGYSWVNVDLDGNYTLNKVSAFVAPNLGSGVSYPDTVTFVAIDAEGNETVIKTFAPAEIAALNSETIGSIELTADCDVVAAKLEVRLTSWNHNAFTFISEVAAFGEAYVAPEQGGESTDDEVGGEEEPTVGTMENPAQITLGVGESTTITVGAESEYYFNLTLPQFGVGYILTVTGNTGFRYGTGMGMPIPDTNGSYSAQVGMPRAASGIVINTTAEEQTYTLTLSNLPAGSSYDNPEIITDNGDYKVTEVLDQFQGYFYQFTAPSAGTITVTMNDADGWTYSVTNNTTSVATDQHWCDDDPVVSSETMTVAEGDVIIIVVNAYNSVETDVDWTFNFTAEDDGEGEGEGEGEGTDPAVGTMENPAQITLGVGESTTITVGAESEYYFNLTLPQFGVGYILTVTGNTGFRYGTGMGMPIPDNNGSYSAQVAMPRAASGLVINTTAEEQTYTLTLSNLPAGSSYDNPEIITDNGDYKVSEILDQFQGYFYQFTAPSAGTITVTMNDADGWTYSVTNNTTSVASDQHWCDDDPIVSSETMTVAEGDVIIIVVNAYNSVETDVDWTFNFTAEDDGEGEGEGEGTDPAVGTMENPAQITLGVGESVTITVGAESDYYFNLTLPQFGVGYILTVTGNTGFRYGTGMGMPAPDNNGSYSAQVAMPRAASGIVINTTAEEQTYTLTLSNLPAGSSYDNPEIITDSGDYKVTEVLDQFQGYFYQFTAPSAGTITVSMNDVDGWTYSITNTTTSVATDQHWCDDDPVVSYEKMDVAEGDVIIIVVNAYNSVDTEVNWNFTFEAAEVYNYAMSDTLIQVGTNDYTVDASYPYTVFTFAPDEVGKYTISSSNAVMGIVSYNGMWITIEPSAETVTESSIVWECLSEGQSIWIAVMADTNAATIAVSKEDVNIEQPTLKDYENIETPEDFEFDGDVDELEGVDYEDDVIDTAVLGDDGYYHLNSADGPIIYVNLNDEMLSLVQAASYGQLSYTDLESNTKIDFTDAFQEYVDAAGESAIYPLTADLMEILTKVCEQRGWASFFGSENEDVWMALCYTMPESDVEPPVDVIVGDINGNGKIDARDYLLLKRAYFGTYTLTCAPEAADINGNGKIDARDYLLLKRAYFGTYTIAE